MISLNPSMTECCGGPRRPSIGPQDAETRQSLGQLLCFCFLSDSCCFFPPDFPIDLEQQTDTVHLLFQINRKMVTTIWFHFDLIRLWKDFSVRRKVRQCTRNRLELSSDWNRVEFSSFRAFQECPNSWIVRDVSIPGI